MRALALALLLSACNAQPAAPLKVQPATAASRSAAPTTLGAAALPPAEGELSGRVEERIDAPPYSYLRITAASGEIWAAVPKTTLDKGASVTLISPLLMRNFESKSLHRTFEQVYFATLAGQPASAGATQPASANDPHAGAAVNEPHAGMAKPAAPGAAAPVQVDKAEGKDARRIEEIYAQRDQLKDHKVVVRGKVTKYNSGIMGKNWLHLHDGSGSAAQGNDDLTVTSSAATQLGDVVTITGTVRLGKDFGAGYAYPVLIEDASIAAH